MAAPSSSLVFSAILCFFFAAASAHNITKILENYPEFSNFNRYLTETKLASEINHRQTITVLAVENGAVSAIAGQSADAKKRILSLHVILDYEDVEKLKKLSKKSTPMTTLYQTTGDAENQNGFLNVTKINGETYFGSMTKGADQTSKLVKTVTSQPYNISVLQVSNVITAPGIENAPVPAGAPRKALAPPPPKKGGAPVPSEDEEAEAPVAEAPSEESSDAPAPSDAPEAADGPASSPPSPDAADEAEGPSSDGVHVKASLVVAVVMAMTSIMVGF